MQTGSSLIADIDACVVPPKHAALWWLGQHGFVVKLSQQVCYIDCFLSSWPGRQVPPLLQAEQINNADLVLGSHDHADHIDRQAWPTIARCSPHVRFVTPALLRQKIIAELGLPDERVWGVDEGIVVRHGGVSVTAVPAAHESLDCDPATSQHPYVGFIVEGNGFRLYHAGDTCCYEGMQACLRRWPLDLALLPINGRDARRLAANCIGNMTYQEAADLAGAIRPGLTVPSHFEMFADNSEDPQRFLDYMRVKYPHLATHRPRHGQRTIIAARPE